MTNSTDSATVKATFIGTIAPLLWSTYPTLTYLIGEAMPPFQLLTLGFSISFALSLVIWKAKRIAIKEMFVQPLKYWVVGIFGILGFNCFYILALYLMPKAEAFLITSIWPMMALIMGAIFLKEPLRRHHIIGCIMGFGGIYLIAKNRGLDFDAGDHLLGYAAALTAALIWSVYSLILRVNPLPKPEFIGTICGATAVGSAILHMMFEPSVPVSSSQLLPLILIGIGSMGLSYYCWNHGVQYGDLRSLNTMVYLGHFTTVGLLMLVGQAHLTPTLMGAFILIIGGAFIGSSGLFKRKKKA